MKSILVLIAVALSALIAAGTTHYVDIEGNAPFTQVQPAINAATAGDTIVVAAGVGYQGFTVDRRLVIFGVGTGTIANEGSRIGGVVTITNAADSTELHGLWIITSVYSNTDSLGAVLRVGSGATGVIVSRCFLENTGSGSYPSSFFLGAQSTAQFSQCAFKADDHCLKTQRSGWSLTLVSCIFASTQSALYAYSGASGVIMASHCVITVGTSLYFFECINCTGIVANCAFVRSGTNYWNNLGSVLLSYCAANGAAPPGSNNIVCSTADFVNLSSYTDPRNNDYHLSAGSVLRNAGDPNGPPDLDSTRADIGIYGGLHPYVENGAPPYPFVLDIDVPFAVPQDGAIRVWARGRVGPTH